MVHFPARHVWLPSGNLTHRTRGLPRGQTLRADPATINPLEELTFLLLLFHLGLIQVIKPPGPMEQFAIFLLGFHLGSIQVIKLPGPMEQFAIFLHLGFIQVIESLGPMEQLL